MLMLVILMLNLVILMLNLVILMRHLVIVMLILVILRLMLRLASNLCLKPVSAMSSVSRPLRKQQQQQQ